MQNDKPTATYSGDALRAKIARGENKTDLERLDKMTEEELEASIATDPDWSPLDPEWHQHAIPHFPNGAKQQITLRLDPEIIDWFKSTGKGYQTRMNAVLKTFISAQRNHHN